MQSFPPKFRVNKYLFFKASHQRRERSKFLLSNIDYIVFKQTRDKTFCGTIDRRSNCNDFLEYAKKQSFLCKYLPDERDWVHFDKHWICNILYTLDTENI